MLFLRSGKCHVLPAVLPAVHASGSDYCWYVTCYPAAWHGQGHAMIDARTFWKPCLCRTRAPRGIASPCELRPPLRTNDPKSYGIY